MSATPLSLASTRQQHQRHKVAALAAIATGCLPASRGQQPDALSQQPSPVTAAHAGQHSHHTRHTHALAGGCYFSLDGKTLLYKGSSLRIPLGFGLCEFPWEV